MCKHVLLSCRHCKAQWVSIICCTAETKTADSWNDCPNFSVVPIYSVEDHEKSLVPLAEEDWYISWVSKEKAEERLKEAEDVLNKAKKGLKKAVKDVEKAKKIMYVFNL